MNNETAEDKITREGLYTGFKVLLSYLGQYRKQILALIFMGTFSAVGNGAIPYIAGRFFDSITDLSSADVFGFAVPLFAAILAIWALVQFVTYLLDWRISILSEFLSNRIWVDYLIKGFGFLLELPLSFHKQHKVGEIGDKINTAAHSLEVIAGRIVINLGPQLLSIVIALVITFAMNPVLAGLLVFGLSIYLFTLVIGVRPLSGYHKEYRKRIWRGFGDAYDAIANTAAIKQATAEVHEQHRLMTQMRSALPFWMKLTKVWSNLTLYQRFTILATQLAIFVISIYYIRGGSMTIGELLAFNTYAAMLFGPFVTIAQNWQTIHSGIVNVQETEKIFQTPTEDYAPKGSEPIELEGAISFDDVSFHYDESKPILKDITFSVKPGEIVALVGESGVGKSTLIDLVSGYHFPTKGVVSIDGRDIKRLNLKDLRSQIAVVPQEVVLFNDNIKNNVRYGNFEATETELDVAAKKAHALDFIERFPDKWEQLVGERGVKLSVGQKQRVAIARAILRKPRILILDEPTSALDAGSEKIITESLEGLMEGRTTFIIAHRLSTVRKANKILVFKEGRIVESGTHGELLELKDGEYRRLYELQIGLHD
ncbi:MAG: ABC transporter ATP-binding protein [Candidatus Taylorbacteria bacterium]|nr:ABC transporter ATP-binding protein [Candidatus Taylorbacteria bacterium]